MTQIWKRGIALLVAAALALCMLGAIPGTAPKAQAAGGSHMKSLNLKWDLKKNKAVKIKTSWPGAGFQDMTATLKNYKVTKAAKKGYKKLTFTAVFNNKFTNPTRKQIKAMSDWEGDYNVTWGEMWVAVVDYKTGKCLEAKNDKNVTVKYGQWKFADGKKFKHWSGFTIQAFKKASVKVTVTYPASYRNLCIGVGGDNTHFGSNKDLSYDYIQNDCADKEGLFWAGKAPFGKTSLYNWKLTYKDVGPKVFKISDLYYTKSKTNSHWMRVK